ncbi:transglutaminase domain-containing protein [Methanosarcina sp. KYL-1]|nr:transglutaminase domain-containing protein [Methanosarcina sp. KYL-1]
MSVSDIEKVMEERVEQFLPDGAGSDEGPGSEAGSDANADTSSASGSGEESGELAADGGQVSGIPEIPKYSENVSNSVYPKDYRVLSLNFRRAINFNDSGISGEIYRITGKDSGYNTEDVCKVFDYVNRNWEYRYDKNAEFFFSASQTIRDGYEGDCDDYSIAMSALMKNMGFNTRIVVVRTDTYGHAYPEIYIGDDQETANKILYYVYGRYTGAESIWYSERELADGEKQYWLNLDWSGSNGFMHPGGAYLEGARVMYYPGGLIEF